MRVKMLNFKKIFSYLLVFTLLFTTFQIGGISKASAEESSQVPGLVLHIGDLSNNQTKVIDKDSSGSYACELLPIGESFTLTAKAGYSIEGVTSSNPTKMSIQPVGNSSGGSNYIIDSITDYSDFGLTVKMKDSTSATPVENTYKIKMKFDTDSSLQFAKMKVTLDNQTPKILNYGETDSNGNYTLTKVSSSVKTAKVELIDNTGAPMTYTVNGGSNNVVNLVGGDNVINITRTYLNNSKQYTLIITKQGEAKLKSLVPSTGTLSPAFVSDTYDYTLAVPTDQNKVAFTPTSVDNASTIKVNGNTVRSGSKSQNISLDEGDNDVEVTLTTPDGDTSTYTVTVTRTEKFRSASLTGLALTTGTLTPAFNKGIYQYTATVDNNVTSIGVTPTAEDPNSKITVNGKTVPSGATSPYISLDEGGNVITVKVTDSKGTSNTYTITVTRKYPANNVNLDKLSVTDGTMSPKFDPEEYLYSVKVPRNIDKVKVLYTSQNEKSKVKINGKEYTNGQSDYIKLNIGANLVTVDVTAEDGVSTTTYKLSVIRGDVEGTNDWVLISGDWTFYNAAGMQAKNQWVKYDNQWYHMDINGHMDRGWIKDGYNWYYLNKDGIMQKGWFYDKGYWYYLQENGAMRTYGWYTYNGKWYFFDSFGEMQTGWTLYKGSWYFLDDHGAMQKGWITNDNNKYYINDDGTMRTGWLYDKKVWYYLEPSGIMIRGWKNIDGKNYYFDGNGAMKTGMFFLDGKWINLNNA